MYGDPFDRDGNLRPYLEIPLRLVWWLVVVCVVLAVLEWLAGLFFGMTILDKIPPY